MATVRIDWWIALQETPSLQEGLRWGFSDYFFAVVEDKLQDNKKENRHPSSWKQLTTDLTLADDGNLYRKRTGVYPTHVVEFLTTCAILDIEPSSAVPEIPIWLQAALQRALKKGGHDGRMQDVRVFVAYTLKRFAKQRARSKNWDHEFYIVEDDIARVVEDAGVSIADGRLAITTIKEHLESL